MKSPLKNTGEFAYNPSASGLPFGKVLPEININKSKNNDFDPLDMAFMSDASQQFAGGGGGGGGFGARFGANMSSPESMAGMAGGIGGIIQGLVGRGKRRDAQAAAQTEYDKMMTQYQNLDTSNLYADVENQYMGMENAYEDLTVNQQQAQFEAQQGAQQRANIMQNLQGAAGGSGIAGLAQAMANQGQLATQRASASIGMQESKINMLRAGEASRIQTAERAGEVQAQSMRLAGASQARGLEWQKTGTQLGMAQQDLAAKNQAIAQADAALYGGIGSVVGTVGSAALGGIGGV